jgi:hypothetical protein
MGMQMYGEIGMLVWVQLVPSGVPRQTVAPQLT